MFDPVWTESNWDTIDVRVYEVQDATYDKLILFGGIALTLLTYIVIVISRAFITKALKRDQRVGRYADFLWSFRSEILVSTSVEFSKMNTIDIKVIFNQL